MKMTCENRKPHVYITSSDIATIFFVDEVKEELDVIFSLLNEKKHLVVLDCKSINYPSQISESALTPIVVYIKIIPKVVFLLASNNGYSLFL